MSFLCLLLILLSIYLLSAPCSAQTHQFQWTFADTYQQISSSLSECKNLKLLISSSTNDPTALGTPPYYLIAFEPSGFSTTSLVGSDPNNISWQVNHAAGTQLLLGMTDSNGNAGGMATPLFTVTAGNDTSCVPSSPSTSMTIKPNVTMDLKTCDPWGLTINGGTPPYNVTILSVGATFVTNVTVPKGFDALTYINRANPNGAILATVSDSTGAFGKTTPIVNTVGSANSTCSGLVSTPGHSSQLSSNSSSHRAAIIAVAIGGVAFMLGGVFFFMYMRRKRRWILDGQDTFPRVWKTDDDNSRMTLLPTAHPDSSYRRLGSSYDPPESSYRGPGSSDHKQSIHDSTTTTPISASSTSTLHLQPEIVPYMPSFLEPSHSSHSGHQGESSSSSHHSRDHLLPSLTPTSSNYSISSPSHHSVSHSSTSLSSTPGFDADRRYAKLAEAHRASRDDNIRRASPSPGAGSRSRTPVPNRPYSAGPIDPDAEPDIIIQHRDGGIVQELPPPYLDHRDRRPPENNVVGGS